MAGPAEHKAVHSGIKEAVEHRGFAIVEGVIDHSRIDHLRTLLSEAGSSNALMQKQGQVFAMRNLLNCFPEVCELAHSALLRDLVEPVLGTQFRAVRGILFDKIPQANWKVPWHQDVTIAVRSRVEASGYGPWTTKAGVLHVQPPAAVLEQMLSVRLHLDACSESNGALRVVPCSHTLGRIPEQQIAGVRAQLGEQVCEVGCGGALLMRPLLLHASSPSQAPAHRRVIHIDFAAAELPAGLQWYSDLGNPKTKEPTSAQRLT